MIQRRKRVAEFLFAQHTKFQMRPTGLRQGPQCFPVIRRRHVKIPGRLGVARAPVIRIMFEIAAGAASQPVAPGQTNHHPDC